MTSTPETSIVFRRAGGHSHDGLTSTLIDTTKYSLFDFPPILNATADTARKRFQDNNKIIIKKFIVDTIEERVLNPQGIEIKANVITARNIIAGTITANELAANLILVNNIIRSNNFDGSFYSNGVIQSNGTIGWAISNVGAAVFNDVTIRGNVYSNIGTIGGWTLSSTSLSGGSTTLYSNGQSTFGNTIIYSNGQISNDTFTLYANGDLSVGAGSITGSSVTVGVFDANTSSTGLQLTSSGYIQASGGGIKIKNWDGGTGTIIWGNSIETGTVDTNQLNSNGATVGGDIYADYLILDPGINTATESATITFINATANTPAMVINRSNSSNMSRHIQFNRSDGAYVGAIRYKNNDNSTMVFVGDITGTSDIRLKENIKILNNTLEIVNSIEPVEFNFIRSPNIIQHGFVAQNLHNVYPMAVEVGGEDVENDPWHVMPVQLIPIITGAIKELSNKVTDLENRLNQIEGV